MSKISANNRRDFNLYLKFYRSFEPGFCPFTFPLVLRGESSAMQSFVIFDSQGKLPKSCKQPRLLQSVLLGKALLNLQIKQWAEGFADCGAHSFMNELRRDYSYFPDWVWTALENQAIRLIKKDRRRQEAMLDILCHVLRPANEA